jgi:transglutaminase-like putative cysteine protease
MLVRVGYEIILNFAAPTPLVLKLSTHPSLTDRLVKSDRIKFTPNLCVREFTDIFGNRCLRMNAEAGQLHLCNDVIVKTSDRPDVVNWDAGQSAISDLPDDTLEFLLGSRYCEIEQLSPIAWQLFGSEKPGWARVQAVCDWIHSNISYGYEHARASKTAYEVYQERTGVCRDFAHLAIAFCRSLNIPARYASGYLGDIGVEPLPTPMDFHAWFEVFLDGQWYAFDARHNVPRLGRVLMVRGRDATDTALITSFGAHELVKFKVWADEITSTQINETSLRELAIPGREFLLAS